MNLPAVLAFATLTLTVALGAAQAQDTAPAADRAALKAKYQRPDSIPFPADNPFSLDRAKLGETLFFDPRLSGSNWISCATCHNPALSWGDGLAKGRGHGMGELGRRTPTVLNLAWAPRLFWDGRARSLEEQALGPIASDAEMHQNLDEMVAELKAIPGYVTRFNGVFPGEGLTKDTIAKAIATYERTIVSGTAPFDRWIAGDETAVSEPAKRGFDLFNGKANCAACHTGWSFTNHGFADIGLPDADVGRGALSKAESMQHAFKTPGLRNIAQRGPYMHDGSAATLDAVVRHYDTGFVERPSLSADMRRLNLTDAEVGELVAFMETLTGDDAPVILPVLPAAQH